MHATESISLHVTSLAQVVVRQPDYAAMLPIKPRRDVRGDVAP